MIFSTGAPFIRLRLKRSAAAPQHPGSRRCLFSAEPLTCLSSKGVSRLRGHCLFSAEPITCLLSQEYPGYEAIVCLCSRVLLHDEVLLNAGKKYYYFICFGLTIFPSSRILLMLILILLLWWKLIRVKWLDPFCFRIFLFKFCLFTCFTCFLYN